MIAEKGEGEEERVIPSLNWICESALCGKNKCGVVFLEGLFIEEQLTVRAEVLSSGCTTHRDRTVR